MILINLRLKYKKNITISLLLIFICLNLNITFQSLIETGQANEKGNEDKRTEIQIKENEKLLDFAKINPNEGGLGSKVSNIETDDPNYEYEKLNGTFTRILNETTIVNNIKYFMFTQIDFFNEKRKNEISFDINENLEKLFGPDFKNNLDNLTLNKNYKKFKETKFKKKTILIGIDGLVSGCIDYNKLPSFRYFLENGSYKYDLRGSVEARSGPSWSSTFCSLDSTQTGINNNKWRAPWINRENRNKYNSTTPINGLDKSFPCIFDHMKEQSKHRKNPKDDKEIVTAFISSWDFFDENFSNKAYPGSIDIYVKCNIRTKQPYFEYLICDSFSLERIKNLILEDTDFLFWYFSSIDVSAHTYSFCSTEYINRVNYIDEILTNFLDFLRVLGILDKVNIIITSDHGSDRSRMDHGNDKWDGNLLVPLFMMGPDFKKNYNIKNPYSILDIAPTIMRVNELTPNENWRGKVINEALISDKSIGKININPSQKFIGNMETAVIVDFTVFNKFNYSLLIIFLLILC